jgi:hypothetical protein
LQLGIGRSEQPIWPSGGTRIRKQGTRIRKQLTTLPHRPHAERGQRDALQQLYRLSLAVARPRSSGRVGDWGMYTLATACPNLGPSHRLSVSGDVGDGRPMFPHYHDVESRGRVVTETDVRRSPKACHSCADPAMDMNLACAAQRHGQAIGCDQPRVAGLVRVSTSPPRHC